MDSIHWVMEMVLIYPWCRGWAQLFQVRLWQLCSVHLGCSVHQQAVHRQREWVPQQEEAEVPQ